jgi:hypothetical protein
MKQTHVAGGPLGVARIDRPHRAPGGHTGPRRGRVVAVLSRVGQPLLAALIVETLTVASFGVGLGTVVAALGAVALLVGLRAPPMRPGGSVTPAAQQTSAGLTSAPRRAAPRSR